jgi:hypothetical protein
MFLNRLIQSLKRRTGGGPRAGRELVMSDDLERRLLREELPSGYFADRFNR